MIYKTSKALRKTPGTLFPLTSFHFLPRHNPFERFLSKEDRLQRSVMNYLKLQYPDVLSSHIPNEGKRTAFERFKAKALGITPGMPDVMVYRHKLIFDSEGTGYLCPGLAIELKIKPNKPTTDQVKILERLERDGWTTAVCYDFEEAIGYIDKHLIPC